MTIKKFLNYKKKLLTPRLFIFQEALKYRDHENFKMVWFEEMKKDLISVIRDMSKFLGYHLTELKVINNSLLYKTLLKVF